MSRISLVLVAVIGVLALAVAGAALASANSAATAAPAKAAPVKLVGKVGPGFTIKFTKGGKAVKTLKVGTYKITVYDKASIHNFHLFGPGVNKKTGVSFTGKVVWTVKVKKGKYTYRCDIHYMSGMIGHFKGTAKTTVVSTPTPTPTATTPY